MSFQVESNTVVIARNLNDFEGHGNGGTGVEQQLARKDQVTVAQGSRKSPRTQDHKAEEMQH